MYIYNNVKNVIFTWGGEISYFLENNPDKWPRGKKKKKTIKIYAHN
jgi:hypothetical protein